MEYNKIVASKTLEIKEGLGLIVELTEGKQANTLSLWLQYKTEEGQWAHKSTKGANAIRIPVINGLAEFLSSNLTTVFEMDKKHTPKEVASKIDVKKLDNETIQAMLKQLGIEIPEVKTPKKAKKEETKELEIDFASILLELAKNNKKTKK